MWKMMSEHMEWRQMNRENGMEFLTESRVE